MSVVNVLVENGSFESASVADAMQWRDRYDLQFSVLADVNREWASSWGNPGSPQYDQHSYTLVDPNGVVLWRREGATTADSVLSDIFAAIDAI